VSADPLLIHEPATAIPSFKQQANPKKSHERERGDHRDAGIAA
jgi:hypothetical protein